MIKHINEIKLSEVDEFSKRFNECSDLLIKSRDTNLSIEERLVASELWFQKRQCLELGID